MRSLYEISEDLQNILNTVEECDGELSEELEKKLDITKEELDNKVDAYCNLISVTKSDIECCKNEKKRINDLQNVRKNLVEKLRSKLLDAVIQFGDDGKSGNKVLVLPLHKLFTKTRTSIDVDVERISILGDYTRRYINELYREGVLVQGQDIDYSGMLAAINALIKADYGEDFEEFTIADFTQLKFRVATVIPMTDFMLGRCDYSKDLLANPENEVETSIYEDIVEASLVSQPDIKYTIAKLENKTSLTIK